MKRRRAQGGLLLLLLAVTAAFDVPIIHRLPARTCVQSVAGLSLALRPTPACPKTGSSPFNPRACRPARLCMASAEKQGAATKLQVAWVGNSFVFFNNLPRMLKSMLKHTGVAVLQRDVLVGGQGLHGHSQDANVTALLAQRAWDAVILQDQSAVPGGADAQKYAESLTALREHFAPCCSTARRVLLYSSWGHKSGSPVLEQFQSAYPSFQVMNARVAEGYKAYKQALQEAGVANVSLAPVGKAFEMAYQADTIAGRDPEGADSMFSRLYNADCFHPSPLGSYLAASVFFGVLTGTSPPTPH